MIVDFGDVDSDSDNDGDCNGENGKGWKVKVD